MAQPAARKFYGGYWSATPDNSNITYYLYFSSDGVVWNSTLRYYGIAVRLVQDL